MVDISPCPPLMSLIIRADRTRPTTRLFYCSQRTSIIQNFETFCQYIFHIFVTYYLDDIFRAPYFVKYASYFSHILIFAALSILTDSKYDFLRQFLRLFMDFDRFSDKMSRF